LKHSAGYGRSKRILLQHSLCDNCYTEQNVFCCDSIDNEYGFVKICKKCVLDYFDKFENETLPNNKFCRSCNKICDINNFIKIKQTRKSSPSEVCKECVKYFESN
jgi:hypothetical protein